MKSLALFLICVCCALAQQRSLLDLAYGKHSKQKVDVFLPANAKDAPVLFMVHGGAWALGDKSNSGFVDGKVAHWCPKGFVLVSVNYRLLPDAGPKEQAVDVATALAFCQKHAPEWGGDPAKFILMGHSAGAHLVAVVASSPQMALKRGAKLWLGTVSLDSAALNVVSVMQKRHFRFHDRAFGKDPAYWKSVSPYHLLTNKQSPVFLVCASRRADSCTQAMAYAMKAKRLGMSATVLRKEMTHAEVNKLLGEDKLYTKEVDAFLATLHEDVKKLLE